ncbi:MAG: O-antigen ligase family protein [Solirubrobacteraceae bacterium]|nr:O-antigen ligase family protein [Solirubrobacteraceae bacterium]
MSAGASLRAAPATLPCLLAVVALLLLAADGGGVRLTSWTPLAFGLLALLALTAVILRDGLRAVPVPVLAALGALLAVCAWSYLSILWAADQGAAWEGANRTLLYLLVAALFGLWRQRPETAAALLATWTVGMVAVAGVVAVRILGADALGDWFNGDRLVQPSSYANAQAATWIMALWPCVILAASPRLPVALRAVLAGGAVLLADLALLSLSRGAVLALPVLAVVLVAVAPGRLRHLAVLAAAGAGLAVTAPFVLDVGPALRAGVGEQAAVDEALWAALLASVAVAVAVACGIVLGRRAVREGWLGPDTPARARTVWTRTVVAGGVLAAVVALAVAGNPVTRASDAWSSFTAGYESSRGSSESRLGELGSNRSDFYRVALDTFAEHPVRGVGADNYQAAYLRLGAARESPRYAHSWPLGTLAQLGLAGLVLMLAWLGASGWAVVRAVRDSGELGAAVALGAAFGFGSWLVHGAGDWFWEFPPIALPAFALLGLALSLVPAREPVRGARWGTAGAGLVLVLAAVAGLSYWAPWASEREAAEAGRTWPADPRGAFERVDRAARLNPLEAGPYLTGGTIAVRRGTLGIADRYFAAALVRHPDSAYATLQRGAIASARGDDVRAVVLLRRAVLLDRRDEVAAAALRTAERGETVDLGQLGAELLARRRAVGTG